MDDPWGSPWADEGPDATPKPQNVIVKPVAPAKESPIGETINSPWEDEDDRFGDWSVAPDPGLPTTVTLDITSSQESNVENGRSDLLAPKNEIEQQSPAWGHTSPLPLESDLKLSPIPPLQLDQDAPPPSDPWATSDENQAHFPSLEAKNIEWREPEAGNSKVDEQKQSLTSYHDVEQAEVDGSKIENKEAIEVSGDQVLSPPRAVTVGPDQVEKSEHNSSRPSSSDNSQCDDRGLPESPRTSIDEPGRPRPIKVSSEEQLPVGHLGSLAEAEVLTPVESTNPEEALEAGKYEASDTEGGDTDGDDFGDFEDFEEGMSESDDIPDASTERPDISSPKAMSPEPVITQKEDFSVLKEHGPINYTIDTTLLGRLFLNVEATEPPPGSDLKIFIPDTIPRDNFSTAEERKIWYRISRYGTMRQYNSGDDENYTRIDWNHSKVRDETLKIVARWMEEDRITGRVTLGGSRRGGIIFGWDKKNAAVPMSTALASKQESEKTKVEIPPDSKSAAGSIASPKSPSTPKSPLKERRRSSVASSIDSRIKTPVEVPQFGWNTSANSSPMLEEKNNDGAKSSLDNSSVLSSPKSPPVVQPIARTKLPPIVPSRIKIPPAIQPLSIVAQQPASPKTDTPGLAEEDKVIIPPVVPSQQPSDNTFSPIIPPKIPPTETIDDDDDWGEMVSSPIVTGAPPLPSPVVQQDEKFMNVNGPNSHNSHISSHDPRDLLRRGHKTTASLSDISTNSIKSSVTDYSQPPLTAGLTPNGFSDFFSNSLSSTTTSTPVTTSTTRTFDPWASADFSIFEKSSSAAPPRPASTVFTNPASRGIVKTSKRPVSFAAPYTPSPLRNQQTSVDIEQEENFRKIIAGLPDLSYMMRR